MHRKPLLVVAIAIGVLAVIAGGVFALYALGGGFQHGFSREASDWSAFGSYFGGVFGSIVGFGTLVLVVISTLYHEFTAVREFDERMKQSHLRMLEAIVDDINFVLGRELRDHGGSRQFGDYVVGLSGAADAELFARLTSRLLLGVFKYCEALHLFRDNVGAHFEYRAHHYRAEQLVQFLERNHQILKEDERPWLAFARGHITPTEQAAP